MGLRLVWNQLVQDLAAGYPGQIADPHLIARYPRVTYFRDDASLLLHVGRETRGWCT